MKILPEHENKKRKLPMPTEAAFERDGLDLERFEDLVLPSSQSCFEAVESGEGSRDDVREGNTLFGREGADDGAMSHLGGERTQEVDETDVQGPGRELVQVVQAQADWAQELREVRKKFADVVASDMTDVKNDLAHV